MSRPSHFSSAYTLVPDNTYTVNGTTYHTDSRGRITSFDGKLSARSAPRSLSAQRNLPGKQPGEDAGHLMPSSRGGSGKVDNLIRMDHHVNTRDYRAMERQNDALLKEGKEVTLHGTVTYPGTSNWPDCIMVTREVTDPATGITDVDHVSWTNTDMSEFEGDDYWVAPEDEYPHSEAEQGQALSRETEAAGANGTPLPQSNAHPGTEDRTAPARLPTDTETDAPARNLPAAPAGEKEDAPRGAEAETPAAGARPTPAAEAAPGDSLAPGGAAEAPGTGSDALTGSFGPGGVSESAGAGTPSLSGSFGPEGGESPSHSSGASGAGSGIGTADSHDQGLSH